MFVRSKINRITLTLLTFALVMLGTACASRNPQALKDVPISNKHAYPVDVTVTDVGSDIPVKATDYQSALVKTISNVNVFTEVKKGASAKLLVEVISVQADAGGFTMDATTSTSWTFIDANGVKSTKVIIGKSTKTLGDTVNAENRSRLAFRGSMEDSIRNGLTWVSGLSGDQK